MATENQQQLNAIKAYLEKHDVQSNIAEAVTKCVQLLPEDFNAFMAEYYASKANLALASVLDTEARALFNRADSDHDNKLTKTEIKNFLNKTPELKKIFFKSSGGWASLWSEMDDNDDNEFSEAEFVAFYSKKMGEYLGNDGGAGDVMRTSTEVDAPSKKDKKKEKKKAAKEAQPQQEGKKKDKKKGEEAAPDPEAEAKAAAKKLKAVIKEGGKKGVEIEGACDMGGLAFFCTQLDEPDGDKALLEQGFAAMNAEADPTEEERKGGAAPVGKVVFSAGSKTLEMICNVPEDKLTDTPSKVEGAPDMKGITATAWISHVLKSFAKSHPDAKVDDGSTDTFATGRLEGIEAQRLFPVKMKDDAMQAAYAYLNLNNCMPPDDSGDESDVCIGDFADDY